MEHVEAGLVGGVERSIHGHAAEGADADAAIGIAAPRAAPVLELDDFARRLPDKRFHDVLVGQKVAPEDRVLRVRVEAVVVAHDRRRAALGGHGVAAHGIDLREDGDGEPVRLLRRGDGRAESRPAAADHE